MMHYELAQLNVARLKAPIDSPILADFVANLDRINELAEQSPGFVWRLQTEDGNATAIRPFGEDMIVNMSVWESVESLSAYAYKSGHVEVMRRRREWFERAVEASVVLWWVPQGHRPTLAESAERLAHLRAHGPTPFAFNFRNSFVAPNAPPTVQPQVDECPAV